MQCPATAIRISHSFLASERTSPLEKICDFILGLKWWGAIGRSSEVQTFVLPCRGRWPTERRPKNSCRNHQRPKDRGYWYISSPVVLFLGRSFDIQHSRFKNHGPNHPSRECHRIHVCRRILCQMVFWLFLERHPWLSEPTARPRRYPGGYCPTLANHHPKQCRGIQYSTQLVDIDIRLDQLAAAASASTSTRSSKYGYICWIHWGPGIWEDRDQAVQVATGEGGDICLHIAEHKFRADLHHWAQCQPRHSRLFHSSVLWINNAHDSRVRRHCRYKSGR